MLRFWRDMQARNREQENLAFKAKYVQFKELLERNNEALEIISELSQMRERGQGIHPGRLRVLLTRVAVNVYRLIQNLNQLSDDRFRQLGDIFGELEGQVQALLEPALELKVTRPSLRLDEVSRDLVHEVGAKAANLGEIGPCLGVAVPRGVVFTAHAYHTFMDQGLKKQINKAALELDPEDLDSVRQVSATISNLIMDAPLPADLRQALAEARRVVCGQGREDCPMVLRSSAVGEDEAGASFAGLYSSVLNPSDLEQAYRQVIASKYSPRAITYRLQKGLTEELHPMCALLMELIPARAGGVMFTRDLGDDPDALLISAVWGLGKPAVDGSLLPDLYRLHRGETPAVRELIAGNKNFRLDLDGRQGVVQRDVDPERAAAPCLTPEQASQLASIGQDLEHYFDAPQDVEWVLAPQGRFYVVQSRPLQLGDPGGVWGQYYPQLTPAQLDALLVEGLQVGSAGAACGPVKVMQRLADLHQVPAGTIMVVPNTTPDLVNILPRVGALLAIKGNTAGHLAIIARELKVPLLIGLDPKEVQVLSQAGEVTVDGFGGTVFAGRVQPLLDLDQRLRSSAAEAPPSPMQNLLEQVLQLVVPLNLLNPRDSSFRPQSIKTFHDLIRFAHEKAINAMFEINDSRLMRKGRVVRLDTPIPLEIYLIDIGGGLAPIETRKSVTPEEILSTPMRALYRGMITPGVRWAGYVPIDFKGFMSVFANTMFDASKYERRLGDKSYAIVSSDYVNFSSRLGYHFSIVDAQVGPAENQNHISFRFKGGAASLDKRERRVIFLREVLERYDFWVDQKADLINARVKRLPQEEMEQKLMMLGRLMGASRQLDVAMQSDAMVDHYVKLFMSGQYSMGHDAPAREG